MEQKLKLTVNHKGETCVVTLRLPVELIEKVVDETGRTRNDVIIKCLVIAIDNTLNKNA